MLKNLMFTNHSKQEIVGLIMSHREMQCVLQAVQGKSFVEIAKSLGIKPETARFYLNNAEQKILNYSKNNNIDINQ